jgi:hypothetical protein
MPRPHDETGGSLAVGEMVQQERRRGAGEGGRAGADAHVVQQGTERTLVAPALLREPAAVWLEHVDRLDERADGGCDAIAQHERVARLAGLE